MNTRYWNAGEAVCGQLVVGLKREISRLQPGDLLEITALSEGAPADLPAWCRITGHALVSNEHPAYVVRKS